MKTNRELLRATTLVALIATLAICGSLQTAASAEYKKEFLAFGVLGITAGQTARLHTVSVGVQDIQDVELLIYDRYGNLLARSPERLLPGRAATLAMPFLERDGNRLEMYAVILLVNSPPRRGYVISTLEVVDDATGKTIFTSVNPEG